MKPAATDLESFIRSAFASHASVCRRRIVGGPAVAIDHRATAVLAPVLNEIFSDIAATSESDVAPDVAIAWSYDPQGCCIIELNKGSGPVRSVRWRQSSRAYSSGLEAYGQSMIRCETSDWGARVIVPARYIADRFSTSSSGPAHEDPIEGRTVLVVEDQLIIALDLEALLREEGAEAVQLCGTVDDALRSLETERPDVAVLDVNLGTTTSFPVARELQRIGVPFIFATGYGKEIEFPAEMRQVPLVAKPYCVKTIREALSSTVVAHV